jgi:dsRNA-specific ribonuclease
MLARQSIPGWTRHRRLRLMLLADLVYPYEGSAGGSSRLASSSRHLTQSSHVRRATVSDRVDEDNKEMSESALEHSLKLLHDRKIESVSSKKGLEERRRGRLSRSQRAPSTALSSWKEHMNISLDRQGEYGDVEYEVTRHRSDRKRSAKETLRREERALTMKRTIESSRSKQLKESPPDNNGRTLTTTPVIPGGGGSNIYVPPIQFEKTEIHYPPSDVYPPSLPMVREVDLLTAARALGVLRHCEVEWSREHERWRKTTRHNEFYEQQGLNEFLDTEQALEYVGDGTMSLISRSLILSQFPGKSVAVYAMATSWLVSNNCFSYMFEDSGLEEERVLVGKQLMDVIKKRELGALPAHYTQADRLICEQAPLPELILPILSHRRKADLLEAYVGALYLTYGFSATSKWCTALLEPWLDCIDRTPEFHQDRFLSLSGEASKRAQRKKEDDERRRTNSWWGRMRSRFFAK